MTFTGSCHFRVIQLISKCILGCVDAVRNHLNPLYFLSFSVFNLFLVIVCFMFTQIAATGYYAVEKCAAWEESILPAWIITFFSPHPNKIMQAYIMNIC